MTLRLGSPLVVLPSLSRVESGRVQIWAVAAGLVGSNCASGSCPSRKWAGGLLMDCRSAVAGSPLRKNTLQLGPGQLTNGGSQCQLTEYGRGIHSPSGHGSTGAPRTDLLLQPRQDRNSSRNEQPSPCCACPTPGSWNLSRVHSTHVAVGTYSHLPVHARSATAYCVGGRGSRRSR